MRGLDRFLWIVARYCIVLCGASVANCTLTLQTTGEVSSKSEDDPPLNPDIEAPEADVALESHAKHSEESASLEPYVERSEGKASLQSTIETSEDDAGFQLAIKRSEESAALELDIKRSEEEADLQLAIKRSEEDVSLAPNVGHSEDNATLGILSKPSEFEPAVEDDGEPPDDDATPGQKKKNNKPWTPEEDAIITQFAGKLEWKEIAAKMPSRSIPTIRRRWATKLSPVALRMVCCLEFHTTEQLLTPQPSRKRMRMRLHHLTRRHIGDTLNSPMKRLSCQWQDQLRQ
jgi:hypothetical protein